MCSEQEQHVTINQVEVTVCITCGTIRCGARVHATGATEHEALATLRERVGTTGWRHNVQTDMYTCPQHSTPPPLVVHCVTPSIVLRCAIAGCDSSTPRTLGTTVTQAILDAAKFHRVGTVYVCKHCYLALNPV